MKTAAISTTNKEAEEAFAYVQELKGFYRHLFRLLILVPGLLAVILIVSPQRMWVSWVIGG